jgi:Tol biopolymer transport system component
VVGFVSSATNLVPGDTNGVEDIFVRDLATDRTERVSVSSNGTQADDFSDRFAPALDRTGRFVAFESSATNLVPDDTNAAFDIFLRDRRAGTTVRVSLGANGVQGNDFSISPALSADARFVAFASGADNLVPDDENGFVDTFVRDRRFGTTSRVSITSNGAEGNDAVISAPALSDDGRFVVFLSGATNLTPEQSRGVFVRDRERGTTALVSVSSSGVAGNGFGGRVAISADGRFVVFDSTSTNLVPNDTNALPDVFVRDLRRRTTERVSVSSSGAQANGSAGFASISADGRYVAFGSTATNLASGVSTPTGRTYVHDRLTGNTRLATRTSDLEPPDGSTGSPALSGDGSVLATESAASNLVPNDTNGVTDVFVQRLLVPPGRRHRG